MFGLALLLTLVVPDEEEYSWAVIALSLVGKLAITASYGVVYVFSAELFPTEVRQKSSKHLQVFLMLYFYRYEMLELAVAPCPHGWEG